MPEDFTAGIEHLVGFLRSRYHKKNTNLLNEFLYKGPEPSHDKYTNLSIAWNLSAEGLEANDGQGRCPIETAMIAAFRLGVAEGLKDMRERLDEKDLILDSYRKLLDEKA